MKLTPEQRTELIDNLYEEMVRRCQTDSKYLRNTLSDLMNYDDEDDDVLLQQHVEYFDEEFIKGEEAEEAHKVDPLDFAYFCLGLKRALLKFDVSKTAFQGELDFVGQVIPYSSLLCVALDDDWGGVFVYDVAEPFGEWCALQLLAGTLTMDAAAARVKQLIKEA